METMDETPRAEIVPVGNELLRGDTVDANSAVIAARLFAAGVCVARCTVVGDDAGEIAAVLSGAAGRAGIVVATGGLGPTEDDVTREAVAAAAGRSLEERGDALASIEEFFARIGRPMRPSNRKQALIPAGGTVLFNRVGTAPGFETAIGGCRVFCLPGPPREMRAMLDEWVMPRVRALFPAAVPGARRKIHLAGVPESAANDRIADLMKGKDPVVGMTARDLVVTVTMTSFSANAEAAVAEAAARVRKEFGDRVFAEGEGATLPAAVVQLLAERGISLATAESCTGGLVGYLVTTVPGSSAVFREGAVTYTGGAKIRALGVDAGVLRAHGEVSAECAAAMAEGAAKAAACRAALAVTGIAGPGGGTLEKPVGLVYIAAHLDGKTVGRELRFASDRETVRRRSAMAALDLLRRLVLGLSS